MATQVSDADLIDDRIVNQTVVSPRITYDSDLIHDAGRSTARGIMTAVVIAAPCWVLIAFALYLLL
jgi:hypothetical protein